jgi:hypothetical protein
MTANMTAYSAMSWPSSEEMMLNRFFIWSTPVLLEV